MQITETCAECLYNKQKEETDNQAYLDEVRNILDNRAQTDTSPYIVLLINRVRERYFGAGPDYRELKNQYNDMVLGMEDALRSEIKTAADPLAAALMMARIGNYIDFGALDQVNPNEFLGLFRDTAMREDDKAAYSAFLRECAAGKNFLLLCDNCGEIVLDKLLLEQVRERFPHLTLKAMVRGGSVLNDATAEDAVYAGLDLFTDRFQVPRLTGMFIEEQ